MLVGTAETPKPQFTYLMLLSVEPLITYETVNTKASVPSTGVPSSKNAGLYQRGATDVPEAPTTCS